MMNPTIFIYNATWQGGDAYWDGIGEYIKPLEDIILESLLYYPAVTYGKVEALSLRISILSPDNNGNIFYTETSGIQLLKKIKNGKFYNVPSHLLLIDIDKNKNAILTALAPLIRSYSFNGTK